MIKIPEKVGPERTVAKYFSKSLVAQDYINPKTGAVDSWGRFKGHLMSSFILPITQEGLVVSIQQFKYGAGEVIRELPAGNIKEGETPVEAAGRELLEETGYQAGRIISLSNEKPIWTDPAASDIYFYPFLGLDCVYHQEQTLDKEEDIEVELFLVSVWLKMVLEIGMNSACCMVTTLLALPYLTANFPLDVFFGT